MFKIILYLALFFVSSSQTLASCFSRYMDDCVSTGWIPPLWMIIIAVTIF